MTELNLIAIAALVVITGIMITVSTGFIVPCLIGIGSYLTLGQEAMNRLSRRVLLTKC
ncbi:hypothetical protein AB6D11_19275 [Vibrio splendidus]